MTTQDNPTRESTGVLWDALCLVGASAISVGAGMIYLPAGIIVGGGFVLAFGVFGARAEARSPSLPVQEP